MSAKLRMDRLEPGRSLLATALIGIGVMAAFDEILFHQILAWHHFYDHATPAIGLLSDGLLHTVEVLCVVGGFLLYAGLQLRHTLAPGWAWAGLFLGLGGFQLLDGTINHKVLRLHQIRSGVDNLLLYDLLWNVAALMLIAIGVILLSRARSRTPDRISIP